jgi:SpoVK/Ycf46/Vps4 family AAA+-type ATPase
MTKSRPENEPGKDEIQKEDVIASTSFHNVANVNINEFAEKEKEEKPIAKDGITEISSNVKTKTLPESVDPFFQVEVSLEEKKKTSPKVPIFGLMDVSRNYIKTTLNLFPLHLFSALCFSIGGYFLTLQNPNPIDKRIHESVPNLNKFFINPSNLDWETLNYVNFVKTIRWDGLKDLKIEDGVVFLTFRDAQPYQNFYIGTRKPIQVTDFVTESNSKPFKKHYFFSSKMYNAFFNKVTLENQTRALYRTSPIAGINNASWGLEKKSYPFTGMQYWNPYFSHLDMVPLKLKPIYYHNKSGQTLPVESLLSQPLPVKPFPALIKPKTLVFDPPISKESTGEWNSNIVSISNEPPVSKVFSQEPLPSDFDQKIDFNALKSVSSNQKKIDQLENLIQLEMLESRSELFNWRFYQYQLYNNLAVFKTILKKEIHPTSDQVLRKLLYPKTKWNQELQKTVREGLLSDITFTERGRKLPRVFNLKPRINRLVSWHSSKNEFTVLPSFQSILFSLLEESKMSSNTRSTIFSYLLKRPDDFVLEKTTNNEVFQRVQEGKSDLLKRKRSGYRDPDMGPREIDQQPWKNPWVTEWFKKSDIYVKISIPPHISYTQFKKVLSSENTEAFQAFFDKPAPPSIRFQNQTFFGLKKKDLGFTFKHDPSLKVQGKIKVKKVDDINKKKRAQTDYFFDPTAPLEREVKQSREPFGFFKNPKTSEWEAENVFYFRSSENALEPISALNQGVFPPLLPKQKKGPPFHRDETLGETKIDETKREAWNGKGKPNINLSLEGKWKVNYEDIDAFHSYRSEFNNTVPFEPDTLIKENMYNLFMGNCDKMVDLRDTSLFTQFVFLVLLLKSVDTFKRTYGNRLFKAFSNFFLSFDLKTFTNVLDRDECIIPAGKTKWKDFVGGKELLVVFMPSILFLRNSRQLVPSLSLSKPRPEKFYRTGNQSLSKGFLLVGPPGTGKTLLVKALSGEANAPVILQPKGRPPVDRGFGISELGVGRTAYQLKALFKLARKLTPSILFLDEIDSLAGDRKDVLGAKHQNKLGVHNCYTPTKLRKMHAFTHWKENLFLEANTFDLTKTGIYHWKGTNVRLANRFINLTGLREPSSSPEREHDDPRVLSQDTLLTLTQLLLELDGLQKQNLLVIGATNRPASLDPALIRPGRLSHIIYLDLPDKQKRLELLKFYSLFKIQGEIDWEWFSNQTKGLSAAHLQTAMNLASLKTIYQGNKQRRLWESKKLFQTQERIDYGIQTVKFRNHYIQQQLAQTALEFNQASFLGCFYTAASLKKWIHSSILPPTKKPKKSPEGEISMWCGIPDFVSKKSYSFIHGPLNLSSKKRNGRYNFYQKYRQEIRTCYLFDNDQQLQKRMEQLSPDSQKGLTRFNEYVNRLFKVHLFSSQLLMNSTCFLNNPTLFSSYSLYRQKNKQLMQSKSKWVFFQQQNGLKIHLLTKPNKSILWSQQKQATIQTRFFGDAFCLNRAMSYTAGRAVVLSLLKDKGMEDTRFDLWAYMKKYSEQKNPQNTFVQKVSTQFITKHQFESYGLALISGKVAETLMLARMDCSNPSSIGQDDLQKMRWLTRIMVEKNLIYGPMPGMLKQVFIEQLPAARNKAQTKKSKRMSTIPPNPLHSLRLDQAIQVLIHKFEPPTQTPIVAISGPKMWFDQPNNSRFRSRLDREKMLDFNWTPFYTIPGIKPSQKNSALFSYDFYCSNKITHDQVKLEFVEENKKPFLQKHFSDMLIHWNSNELTNAELGISQLIFETFNQCFILLDTHRELMDYFSYYLLVHGKMNPMTQKKIATMWFNKKG